jgi:hypothetical protein
MGRTRRPPHPTPCEGAAHDRLHPTRPLDSAPGWGPPPGWGQPLPGWRPLVDPDPLPLRAARSLGRWWWPILTLVGFLAVVTLVLDREDRAARLSGRGLLTIALATAVVVLLTIHRRSGLGPLTRALAEYTTVALLAALLAGPAASAIDQQAANHAADGKAKAQARADVGDDQPAVIRAVTKLLRAGARLVRAVTGAARWLVDLWRQASQKADAGKGEAMAAPPPSALSIWRFHP